jgi:hypothetical protein
MSFYISKVHRTNENGEDEFIYYTGNYHWSSDPANRLTFDTAEEAATYLYEFGGAVTDVEPAPYVPPTPVTTVESTPVIEEPMVTFDNTPVVEEPVINFSSGSTSSGIDFSFGATSSQIFSDTTTSFGSDTTTTFS